jgi:hypothetical protein
MRSSPFSAICLFALCLVSPLFCRAQTVTQLRTIAKDFLVVQVSINGSGPYSFLLDTGSNRTLVCAHLLAALGVPSGKLITVNMATGVSFLRQAVISRVGVGDLAVDDLEVEVLDARQVSRMGQSIEGVLGEDFLKHFDLLLDNHAKTLTLDESSHLADSLTGDRVPLLFSGSGGGRATVNRLVVNAKIFSSQETMHFLIDSGSNYPVLIPSRVLPSQGRSSVQSTLQTFGGTTRCQTDTEQVTIGKNTHEVDFALCQGKRGDVDVDGMLPTNAFRRLFISHSGGYAILDPHLERYSASAHPRKGP